MQTISRRVAVVALLAAIAAAAVSTSSAAADPYFPAFHVRPPANWINDPNGPYRDPETGLIHLWMQYNPNGAKWGDMTWYHTISRDYVTWERIGETAALTFDPAKYPYANVGFFTGSMTRVLEKGSTSGKRIPVIMYTCASDKGQLQCLARPKNASDPQLIEWVEDAGNPVIAEPPAGARDWTSFRDPTTALWDSARQRWIVHFGMSFTRTDNYQLNTAAVIGYTANANFEDWQYDGVLYEDLYVPDGMYECPDFFELKTGDASVWVLKVSTYPRADFYALGSFDWKSRRFSKVGSEVPLDYGDFYYASKTMYDPITNQRILWGWVTEDEPNFESRGWAGIQAIPRVIEYDAVLKLLRVFPLPALKGLRESRLYSSTTPATLTPNQKRTLVPPSGNSSDPSGVAMDPVGPQLQQEIIANFSFPADLFTRSPSAFVGLQVREVSATQFTRVGITAFPLGGRTLSQTNIPGGDYMDLPMDPTASAETNAANCSQICKDDRRCVAWTYVLKGKSDGRKLQGKMFDYTPRCSLKSNAEPSQSVMSSCCTSGYVASPLFAVDRTNSGSQGVRTFKAGRALLLPGAGNSTRVTASLHIYNDHSITESFKDDGLERITSRLYIPEMASAGVSAISTGGSDVVLETAQVYQLRSIWKDGEA